MKPAWTQLVGRRATPSTAGAVANRTTTRATTGTVGDGRSVEMLHATAPATASTPTTKGQPSTVDNPRSPMRAGSAAATDHPQAASPAPASTTGPAPHRTRRGAGRGAGRAIGAGRPGASW